MNTTEIILLRLFCDSRAVYEKYVGYVQEIESKPLAALYGALERVYSESPDLTAVSPQILGAIYETIHPNAKDIDVIHDILGRVREADVGEAQADALLGTIRRRNAIYSVAKRAVELHSKGGGTSDDLDQLRGYIEQELDDADASEEASNLDDQFITDDLSELYHSTIATPGLRWRLKALNMVLGSLRKGDFGFLFSRPETGKTTFLASEVSYMAEQAGGVVLWFNFRPV